MLNRKKSSYFLLVGILVLYLSCANFLLNNRHNTLIDVDGNTYSIVKIGNQTWTAENLRTTKFNDGTAIPSIDTTKSVWLDLTTPGYCFYNLSTNQDTNKKYGALYNWYTVNTGKLAPAGWHVPTLEDWQILESYLIDNGYNYDGSIGINKTAKALAANSGWVESTDVGTVGNNQHENDSSGFSAFPAGFRTGNLFIEQGNTTNWWGATPGIEQNEATIDYFINSDQENHIGTSFKKSGVSVRLVKNK